MLFGKPAPTESPQQIAAELARGEVVLVDVREPGEFAHERIEGAILHPLSAFDAHALPHPAGRAMVFMCGSGKRSAAAFDKAVHAGLHPRCHMEGGIAAWKEARLPVISGSHVPS